MAKPVLGKGLGELLKDSQGANRTRATLTAAAAQSAPLSEGMTTLVRGHQPPSDAPTAPPPNEQRRLRWTLFAADAGLTLGALIYAARQPALNALALSVCGLVVLLGAWLGWCGLRLSASPRDQA